MTATNPRGDASPKQIALTDLEHATNHLDEIATAAEPDTPLGEAIRALVHAVAHLRDAVTVLAREMPDDD